MDIWTEKELRDAIQYWMRNNRKIVNGKTFYGDQKYTFNQLRQHEDGPQYLRSQLPARFSNASTTQIRDAVHRISSTLNNDIKPPPEPKREKFANDCLKWDAAREKDLSAEYLEYIDSIEWQHRSRQHKQDCNQTCQVCKATNVELQVHHNVYPDLSNRSQWGTELWWQLLCVCVPCHSIVHRLQDESEKPQLIQGGLF